MRGGPLWIRAVVGAMVIAAAVGVWGQPVAATGTFGFDRFAGGDRYDTARLVGEAFAAKAEFAVVATGERFPDALAGSYLAGVRSGPIVLTRPDALPSATAAALNKLGTTNVTILGGTAAVSSGVENDLRSRGYKVERIAGASRYQTAQRVAQAAGAAAVGSPGGKKTAIVSSGENFPDALAAGPLSFASKLPTLLTPRDRLASEARAALSSLGIGHVLIPGGTAAVSQAAEAEIAAMGISVQRFAGTDRSATAALLADYAVGSLGFGTTHVNLARGNGFPDALAGGPHGGKDKSVVLLTESPTNLSFFTHRWLRKHEATLADGHIFGGTAAVSAAVQAEAEAAAGRAGPPALNITGGPANDSVTNDTTPTYDGTATDDQNVASVEVKVDGGAFSNSGVACVGCGTADATWSFTPVTPMSAGNHTFTFRARDNLGLPSEEISRTLTIDTSAPVFDAIRAQAGNSTVTALFSEPLLCSSVSASDFTARVNNAPVTVNSASCAGSAASSVALALGAAPAGGQTAEVTLAGQVTDPAGNTATPTSRSATAGSGADPDIAVNSGPADNARTNDNTPTYAGTASDSDGLVVRVEVRLDGGSFSTAGVTCVCGGPGAAWSYTPSALADGRHTLEFRAVDSAGGSDTATRTVIVDTVTPRFTSISATPGTTITASFSETLDCSSVSRSDFVVFKNSTVTPVDSTSCSGADVTLTLGESLASGNQVRVDLVGMVTDPAGNQANVPQSWTTTVREGRGPKK
jgi:putative cell wall-binding protein